MTQTNPAQAQSCESQPYYRTRVGGVCKSVLVESGVWWPWCEGVKLDPIPRGSTTQHIMDRGRCHVEHGAKGTLQPVIREAWYLTQHGRWSVAKQRWADPHGWNEGNKWDRAAGMWRAAQLASPTSSTQACGRTTVEGDAVLIQGRGLRGVRTCGSPWSCPHCSARLARDRQAQLAAMAEGAEAAGLHARLVLLTTRHDRGDDIRETTDRILSGWRSLVGTGAARKRNKRIGVVAAVRGLEVTHGENGWHPHLHAVVWFRSEEEADAAELTWRAAWEASEAGVVSSRAWGWQKPRSAAAAARYAGEGGASGLGLEVGAGQTHSAAVWAILERLANSGEPSYHDWQLWQTYAEGMKGRRALGWFNRKGMVALMTEVEEEDPEEAKPGEVAIELPQRWLSFLWRHALLGAVLSGHMEWSAWEALGRCVAEDGENGTGIPRELALDMGWSESELARCIRWGRVDLLPF